MADHTDLMRRAANELETQARVYKNMQIGVKNWHRPDVRIEHERMTKLVAELRIAGGVSHQNSSVAAREILVEQRRRLGWADEQIVNELVYRGLPSDGVPAAHGEPKSPSDAAVPREPTPNDHWCKGCNPDNCPGCRNPGE